MPHESRESSDLGVMGTDKEQRCARRADLPGLDSVTAAEMGAEEEEWHRCGQQH